MFCCVSQAVSETFQNLLLNVYMHSQTVCLLNVVGAGWVVA